MTNRQIKEKGILRKAIAGKCKDCIYDPLDTGTWRQQVDACTINECSLFEVRPMSRKQITKEETNESNHAGATGVHFIINQPATDTDRPDIGDHAMGDSGPYQGDSPMAQTSSTAFYGSKHAVSDRPDQHANGQTGPPTGES